ncbi:MAG: AMIN domain-containing protein, partial [Gammaproteobacteria bacterium]
MLHALMKLFLLCCLLLSGWAQAMQLTATRMWPSPEYTRITLEAAQPVAHTFFTLSNPERLVIDLEGVQPGPALDGLTRQLSADDRYVGGIRAGLNRPGVTRVVVELKQAVKPAVFQLQPTG